MDDTSNPGSKRARTRQKLIEAATTAIGEKGFDGVTLDQIAAGAGLTKGAIYDHFGSKEALFLAVMQADRSHLPFPDTEKSAPAKVRMRDFAAAVVAQGERTKLRVPLQAAYLLYSLTHPEQQAASQKNLAEGFAQEQRRLLEAFAPEELSMAPDRFILMLEAMIPGLMFIKSQAPELVSDEAVMEIFSGLLRKP